MITIAIDGLSTTGKSTLSKMIAQKYGYKNFNTGAVYRCIALVIIENNLDIHDIQNVLKFIKNINVNFENDKIFLNGKDVTEEIYKENISLLSTEWATKKEIKDFVNQYQKRFILENNTIMEGRDIGTRIAPNADVKFYLYSDFETRVERLWQQNKNINKEEIRKSLKIRDYWDIHCGNFVKPINSIEIDTTHYTIKEVYEIIVNEINKKLDLYLN